MTGKWIEVLSTGTHTSSAGQVVTYTEADLDKIASNYNSAEHEAPIVIGHPASNAPAWGWVETLERKGKTLMAKLKDVQPEFAEMVKKGLFKKRSVSLYPDLKLRHVGFLGAQPPAVKGLADIAFSEDEAAVFEWVDDFSEASWNWRIVGRIFGRLRDWLIAEKGIEEADKIISGWEIQDVSREPETETKFQEETTVTLEEMRAQVRAEYHEKLTAAEAAATAARARVTELETTIKQTAAEARKAEFASFCDGLVTEGKLKPADKDSTVALLLALDAGQKIEFSDGTTKVEKTAVDALKERLAAAPKVVEFGEMATHGAGKPAVDYGEYPGEVDPERMALHKAAVDLCEAEKIEYGVALARVLASKGGK